MTYWHDEKDEELESLICFADGFVDKRILEVGCGNGRITRKYAQDAAFVDAIDPDEEKIKKAIAAAQHAHVHYHTVAIEDFYPKEQYDLVILAWSL